VEYHENLAALLIELEAWTEAEEALRRALELGATTRSYLLAGDLAQVFGDYARAEAAYRVGLEEAPRNPSLLRALGRLWILRGKWDKANLCAADLASVSPALAASLKAEITAASTEGIACAACGREWRTPRDLPAQSGASIRGIPPDEAPAGACPCCAKVYCIGCVKAALVDNRFVCPECGENLKLADNRLRWLVRESLKGQSLV